MLNESVHRLMNLAEGEVLHAQLQYTIFYVLHHGGSRDSV